jgi:hypothetical protein
MSIDYKEITNLINENGLNFIRIHLLSTVIKYEEIIKEEISNSKTTNVIDIINKNIGYMKEDINDKYASIIFTDKEHVNKIENFYDEVSKIYLNKFSK